MPKYWSSESLVKAYQMCKYVVHSCCFSGDTFQYSNSLLSQHLRTNALGLLEHNILPQQRDIFPLNIYIPNGQVVRSWERTKCFFFPCPEYANVVIAMCPRLWLPWEGVIKNHRGCALNVTETGPVAVSADGTFALLIILVHGMVN